MMPTDRPASSLLVAHLLALPNRDMSGWPSKPRVDDGKPMRVAVFSARNYDRNFLDAANMAAGSPHQLSYHEAHLSPATAILANGAETVCAFVNDDLGRQSLEALKQAGSRLVALRSAGFNNVDLAAAAELGIAVARVPAYSPHAVAEHTIALLLALVRRIHRAYARVREGNFALDGLLGFDIAGRTVAVIGTGRIGIIVGHILNSFGCIVRGCDPKPDPGFPGAYVSFEEAARTADILTFHCPLTSDTRHLVDANAIAWMKPGVTIINTSRGAVIDTPAVIDGLKSGRVGLLGLDVYEEEADMFFKDMSEKPIHDDVFARLLTFPNVLITGHQGFFTEDAMQEIARITIANCSAFEREGKPLHPVAAPHLPTAPA